MGTGKRRAGIAGLTLIVAGSAWPLGAGTAAARTVLSPSVGIEQAIDLSGRGDDDIVTWSQLTAGLNGSVDTRRVKGTLGYQFRQRIEEIGEVANQQAHSLVARLGADVVPRLLTFDAGASASLVDRQPGFLSVDVDANDPDLTQTYNFYVQPGLTHELGSFATVNASYRFSHFEVGDDNGSSGVFGLPSTAASDSTTHDVFVALANRADSSRFSWSLNGTLNDERSSLLDGRYRVYRGVADVEYALNRTLSLVGSAGYEDIRNTELPVRFGPDGLPLVGPDGGFVVDTGAPRRTVYERDGLVWDVGIRLTPSRRTSALIRGGKSAGATNINAEISYRPSNRFGLRANWSESLTTNSRQRTSNLAGLPLEFLLGSRDPLAPGECVIGRDPGTGSCINLGVGSLNNAVFRGRLGSVTLEYGRGRTQAQLVASYYRRRYLNSQQFVIPGLPQFNSNNLETSYGLTAQAQHDLGQGRSMTASLFVERAKTDLGFSDGPRWFTGFDGEYVARMSREIEVGGRGTLSKRFSDDSPDSNQAVLVGFMRYLF